MLCNSEQNDLHIHTFLGTSELSFHRSIVRGYHVPPAFRTLTEAARHAPHSVEESQRCGSLWTIADENVDKSGIHYSSLTHPRFRCSRPTLTENVITFSTSDSTAYLSHCSRSLPIATVLFSWLGFVMCYGAHIRSACFPLIFY